MFYFDAAAQLLRLEPEMTSPVMKMSVLVSQISFGFLAK